MGYQISSLAHLPVVKDFNLYIFVIFKYGWTEGIADKIIKNFSKIAGELGPNAAIVRGNEGDTWPEELAVQLWRREDLHRKVGWHAYNNGPGLIILDAHPQEVKDDSLVLYVPLKGIEESFGSFDGFFDSLLQFAKAKNTDFIKKFREKEVRESGYHELLEIVDIKPNFFGIGVNISRFLQKLDSNRRQS